MMKKLLFFTLFLFAISLQAQQEESKKPLSREDFQNAVRLDFNNLIGNDPTNVGNSLITTFDKNESSIKGVFTYSPHWNKQNYQHSFSGSIKFGESTNIFNFGNSEMPLVNLALRWNYLFSKTWFYEKDSEPTKWTHKRYWWFSPELSYDNNKYKIFDSSRNIQDQLYNVNYSKVSGKLSLNFYAFWDSTYWNTSFTRIRPAFFYVVADYEYREGNNVGTFDKVEILDDQPYATNEGSRTVRRTTLAYSGSYSVFNKHIVSGEALIGVHKNISLDFFGSYVISDQEEDYVFGSGLYFLVKNKKNEPTVNFGMFIQKNENKDAFIGFKTKLPISSFTP